MVLSNSPAHAYGRDVPEEFPRRLAVPVPSRAQAEVVRVARDERDALVIDARHPGGATPSLVVTPDGGVSVDGVDLGELAGKVSQVTLRFHELVGLGPTPAASARHENEDEDAPAPGTGERCRLLRELHEQADALTASLTSLLVRTEIVLHQEVAAEARRAGIDHDTAARAATGIVQSVVKASPSQVTRRLSGCRRLVHHMPGTFTLMANGKLPVPMASEIGTAAHSLSQEGLDLLDAAIVRDLPLMEGAGVRAWSEHTRELAGRLEPSRLAARHREARAERYLHVAHEKDGMSHLSAYIPTIDAIAIDSMLRKEVDRLADQGGVRRGNEYRTFTQMQADLFTDTLLARDGAMDRVKVELQVTMDLDALLLPAQDGNALINGHGPVPAAPLREQILDQVISQATPCDTTHRDGDGNGGDNRDGARVSWEDQAQYLDLFPPDHDPHLAEGCVGQAVPPQNPTPREEPAQDDESAGPEDTMPTGAPAPGGLASGIPAIRGVSRGTGDLQGRAERRRAMIEAERSVIQQDATITLRRLFTHPTSGQLVAMDSRSRFFPPNLAKFLKLRDRYCRGPYCNAPIRHLDHVTPAAKGGPTSAANGQGLCAHCNLVREAYSQAEASLSENGTHQVTWDLDTGEQVSTSSRPLLDPMLPTTRQYRAHVDEFTGHRYIDEPSLPRPPRPDGKKTPKKTSKKKRDPGTDTSDDAGRNPRP